MKHRQLKTIPIDLLVRGKYQPRKQFDSDELQELADSIKSTNGLLQPIVVRPLKNNHYEIVAGERRWRALQLAGFSEAECLVDELNDEESLQAAIIENIIRAELNPIEEAEAYQRLIDEFDYVHEEIACSLGKSRASITNALRLLKLHPDVQHLLIDKQLSEGHGKILAGLPWNEQFIFAKKTLEKQWNVRKLEAEIKKFHQREEKIQHPYTDANVAHLESHLSEHLGNRVSIQYEQKGGGYLTIRFNNVDELEGHFDKMGFELEK
jgi:ParB family chromosome partitioning protein